MEIEEPLGVLYLVGYIKDYVQNALIDLIDAHVTREAPKMVAEQTRQKNYDFILISTLSIGSGYAYELIKWIRQSSKTTIIMGGPHVTALPEECLRAGADYCVIGEGEATVTNLLKILIKGEDPSSVDGIAFFSEGSVIRTRQRELIDLKVLNFPDFSLLPSDSTYKTSIHIQNSNEKALPIMASRGCVNDCPFCSSKLTWRRKLRFRTVGSVVNEIEFIVMKYSVHHFHFQDDDLLLNRSFLRSLCQEIKRRKLDIKFCFITSVKAFLALADEEVELLQESGMRVIEIGIESLIPEVLQYLKKTYTIYDIPLLSSRISKFNIDARPLIMYLVPGETYTGYRNQANLFQETLGTTSYLKKNWNVNPFVFTTYASAYTPLPGTAFHCTVNSLGIQLKQSLKDCSTGVISFLPNSLLEDCPQKSGKLLSKNIHELIKQAKQHSFFPLNICLEEYLNVVWEKIDAIRTTKEIANELYSMYSTKITYHQTLTATTLILIILAESGFILSN
ncbi:MAG: B12-binding domain-containing radical SAM protein [Christensenellaceae bacterium]|nr:B12-binding domain-containing radical SAM protein [Christensenellaceae bacterium]